MTVLTLFEPIAPRNTI